MNKANLLERYIRPNSIILQESTKFNHLNEWKIIIDKDRYFGVQKEPNRYGRMALVYKAYDFVHDRFVALKILRNTAKSEKRFASISEREAKAISQMNHPGIPKIFDYFETDTIEGNNQPVIVMEYIEGPNLDERLTSKTPLEKDEAIKIINQTASVIDYADKVHQRHHGDLSTGQIMIGETQLKVVDWNSADEVNEDGSEFDQHFAAPERQVKQNRVRNILTEEFSLAAIAYHIITGKFVEVLVSDDQEPVATVNKMDIKNSTLKYNFEDSDLEKLQDLFDKSLATDPNLRYKTAGEFSEEFEKIMKNAKGTK